METCPICGKWQAVDDWGICVYCGADTNKKEEKDNHCDICDKTVNLEECDVKSFLCTVCKGCAEDGWQVDDNVQQFYSWGKQKDEEKKILFLYDC